MYDARNYIIVTPVRDEVAHVQFLIQSMLSQTVQPLRWIIVDDGSTDGTSELLDRCAAEHSFITVVHRGNRGFRANGGGVMEAFHAGFSLVGDQRWDYLVKLDADLSFDARYFEHCFREFEQDSKLGIGGGTVCCIRNGQVEPETRGDPPFHVRGATKIYRNACWQAIQPLARGAGWDTIDEVTANHRGWSTRTFPALNVVQHKPTGGADGHWSNAFKNGRANYATGYHPAFMLAKCLRRSFRRPLLVEAVAQWTGYCSGYVKGLPTLAEAEVVRYLRHQQWRRLTFRQSIYG
jgi:poly-beta-1,6-N-acetyl-D-glucosamine synthase